MKKRKNSVEKDIDLYGQRSLERAITGIAEERKMQKPDLDDMWETFVKIPSEDKRVNFNVIYNMIRFKVNPVVSSLIDNGKIYWYCFLIHNRYSGVPASEDDDSAYFHIRFAVKKNVEANELLTSLPDYCVMTKKRRRIETISGIDKSLLKNQEIEEAWRIIGEQSEWLLNVLNIYKEDINVPPKQIAQFLHYYANMTQLQVG